MTSVKSTPILIDLHFARMKMAGRPKMRRPGVSVIGDQA
jgi:hypothetical protein